MTILYCDCFSGISGDMFLAALLDAGLPPDYLTEQLRKLGLDEFEGLDVRKVQRGALQAALLELYIHPHGEHDHAAHDHHAHQRGLSDIRALIQASTLSSRVQQTSLTIFEKLAQAEAKVHGVTPDEVHFHEVGAVDSILDIVGAAVGLEYFDVQAVYASPLPLGSGEVHTQHGTLPIPAPAALELMRMAQAPLRACNATVELVTPTGAAILAALATFEQPEMRLLRTGTGSGKRDLPWPNILRVLIGDVAEMCQTHVEIETNVDDMNPQVLGHTMTRLLQTGALDVYFTPIYMKKNRPATRISVIARSEDEETLSGILLRETSTLGVRITALRRREAQRQVCTVATRFGEIPLKLKIIDGKVVQAAPEYDACVRAAEQHQVPLTQVMQEAMLQAHTCMFDAVPPTAR
ncbi:MAG: nickel pincer cofactor biosynthesis protein LarC [Anaerolineae bacterium]|nr:nickel pincer cofactor biosynthesis protein LarC [Anaerolineae bacterium]